MHTGERTKSKQLVYVASTAVALAFIVTSLVAIFYPTLARVIPLLNLVFVVFFLLMNRLVHGLVHKKEKDLIGRLEKQEIELREALDQAQAAIRARQSIISNMSHEFRTPLNSVIGFAELLQEGETDPEKAEMAACVSRSGWDLLEMVNKLVKLAELSAANPDSRSNSGSWAGEEVFTLAELISRLDTRYRNKALERKLGFVCVHEGDQSLRGDLESLIGVLEIFVENAIKYSDSGDICISARELAVADGKRVVVECKVRDQGKGIDAATMARISEPFMQGEDPLTKRYSGCGTGLYTARKLAENLRADLRIESNPGEGTSAFLVVPLETESTRGVT
jgi:signal transduction histidine kinase